MYRNFRLTLCLNVLFVFESLFMIAIINFNICLFFFLEKLKLSQFFMLLHFDRLVVINFLPVYV